MTTREPMNSYDTILDLSTITLRCCKMKPVGNDSLHAAEHGSFNRIRQVAPMCPNLILGPASLPSPISIGSAVFAQLTGVTQDTDKYTQERTARI